jgi:23S rRNA (pseudouridine1915-N3)-methyltransferase
VKIKIIACGKLKERYYQDACAEYIKRLSAFCTVEIIELAENAESKDILSKITTGAVIVLDPHGENITSETFAEKIEEIKMHHSTVTFIIGGSDGLPCEVKKKANYMLSFGKMTYPHRLARVMLLEQIYRAFMIAAGRSYHK